MSVHQVTQVHHGGRKTQKWLQIPTCWFNVNLSLGDLLIKLDIKDRGNIEAALPTRTKPSSIELTPADVLGLQKHKMYPNEKCLMREILLWYSNYKLILIKGERKNTIITDTHTVLN